MKIFLSGGGTLGPVVPLLAVAETYQKYHPEARFIWVGTGNGPEKELVKKYLIPFYAVPAGKWRRYFSVWNIFDWAKIIIGFFYSIFLIVRHRPALVISAGGFVSVPLHWAAALLGVPAWIHQQDLRPGLSNKLMAWTATKITTALKESRQYFNLEKTEWIGNPVRNLLVEDWDEARKKLGIVSGSPVIFALGGGTGSSRINELVAEAVPQWPRDWQIVHLVGKERPRALAEKMAQTFSNYHAFQFFTDEMAAAYLSADVVIARAGFGTLTELAALGKPAIILPMSGTHQEENAKFFANQNAIIEVDERYTNGLEIAKLVKQLVLDKTKATVLGRRLQTVLPPAEPEKIKEIIEKCIE